MFYFPPTVLGGFLIGSMFKKMSPNPNAENKTLQLILSTHLLSAYNLQALQYKLQGILRVGSLRSDFITLPALPPDINMFKLIGEKA